MSSMAQPTILVHEVLPIETAAGIAYPGTVSLGMSYDVFEGEYASPDATRRELFDLGESEDYKTLDGTYVKPKIVRVQPTERGKIVTVQGSNSNSFQRDRAAKVGLSGGYGFFQGSLDVEFSQNVRRCTAFNFVSKTDQYFIALLSLDVDGALPSMLTDQAREALETMDPEELYSTYGTHFLTSLYIGATAVYSAATNTASYSSTTDISAAAELSYKALTSQIKVDASSSEKKAIDAFRSASTVRVSAQGGKAELAHHIANGEYDRWIESVRTHLAFVDLRKDSLQPLWTLCSRNRRTELEKAYAAFASNRHRTEPDPDIVPIYAYHQTSKNPKTSRWHYSTHPDVMPSWNRATIPFYAYGSNVPGTVPVYEHEAERPQRYKYSTRVVEGQGWSDGLKTAFYAFAERGKGLDAVYAFSAELNPAHSGWHYTTSRTVPKWINQGVAFYVPQIEGPGYHA